MFRLLFANAYFQSIIVKFLVKTFYCTAYIAKLIQIAASMGYIAIWIANCALFKTFKSSNQLSYCITVQCNLFDHYSNMKFLKSYTIT